MILSFYIGSDSQEVKTGTTDLIKNSKDIRLQLNELKWVYQRIFPLWVNRGDNITTLFLLFQIYY